LREVVEEGFNAADQKTEDVRKEMADRMDVIEGSTWSGRLTSKFLTASEKLKIEPDVGILFALSTASKTITSDTVTELQAVALSECLRAQDCKVETLELSHSQLGVRGAIMLSQVMSVNSCLTTINIGSCNIGAAGALALWHYVRATKCPLEVIDIRDNNVGQGKVVQAMELAIAKKPTLRAVGFDLGRDSLVEAARIVQVEPEMFHLHVPPLLDLSACGIMDQDVPALVTLLLRVSVTTSVSVCDNQITEEGVGHLTKVLEANQCIEAIATAGNSCDSNIVMRPDDGRLDAWACLYPTRSVRLEYTSDFDESGALFFLGTLGRTTPYGNPARIGQVTVTSSEGRTKQHFFPVVGRERAGAAIYYKQVSWFAVDLGHGRALSPSAYTLRHGKEDGTDALRHWEFQGSHDGSAWTVIRAHENDSGLSGAWATATWLLDRDPTLEKGYRYLRIRKTGLNSSGKDHLTLGGMELYGDLHFLQG